MANRLNKGRTEMKYGFPFCRHRLDHDPSYRNPDLARYNTTLRSRSALVMTETEDRLIAAAAIIGDSRSPVAG